MGREEAERGPRAR